VFIEDRRTCGAALDLATHYFFASDLIESKLYDAGFHLPRNNNHTVDIPKDKISGMDEDATDFDNTAIGRDARAEATSVPELVEYHDEIRRSQLPPHRELARWR